MTWQAPTLYTPGSPATPAAASTDWQQWLSTNLAALMPVGAYVYIHATPGSTTLVNGCYLECNGQAVSRSNYSSLFSLIGTTYGSGNGSTTFNLPDAAGRTLIGAAGTGGNADVTNLGQTDGNSVASRAARHYHSVSESTHNHTANTGTSGTENASHDHTYSFTTQKLQGVSGTVGCSAISRASAANTSLSDAHTHSASVSVSNTSGGVTVTPGGSQPVDNPAYICAGVLFIKAL